MANEKAKIEIDTSVNQSGLKKGLKESQKAVKDFAKSALQELVGVDQILYKMTGGPVAMGEAVAKMGKQAVAALNDMAAMYREQEQAEAALQNAAKNNPYLNERSVRQLNSFANEMQRLTGIDSVAITQTQTRLASLGRNQQEIQKILTTAADMAAGGIMSYDEAVNELNNSYNGIIRTSGRLYPELKKLSKEAFASGEAIDIIAGKVSGAAAEAMKTGAGSVTAYQNAIGDLKKIIGSGWEDATRPGREWITKIIERFNKAAQAKIDIENLFRDKTADLDVEFAELTDAQKRELEKIGREAGAYLGVGVNARLADMSFENAVEDALTTLAESSGFTVEMIRRTIVEYGRFDDKIRETLLLLGEKTVAEQDAAMAAKAAREARQASILADTAEAKEAADKAGVAARRAAEAVERGNYERVRGLRETAEAMLDIANQEAANAEKKRNDDNETAKYREANLKALDEELKRSIRNAETKGEITKGEAARLRALIDARKEGEALSVLETKNLELQNQFLMANMQAYENLLTAADGYIDGTDETEQQRLKNMEQAWVEYKKRVETEKFDDEQKKQRLQELASRQKELASELQKIYEDVQGEAKRQAELAEEKEQQEKIAELRRTALKKSLIDLSGKRKQAIKELVDYEAQTEKDKFNRIFEERKEKLIKDKKEQEDALGVLLAEELSKYEGNATARAAINKQFNEQKAKIAEDTDNAIVQMELNLAAEIQRINSETAEALKQTDRELLQERLKNIQEYVNASQQIASSISAIWTNAIDYRLDEELRKNDEIEKSDEERAQKEKELTMEAAKERYKADLFAWSANVTMATAQAAMAALTAYQEGLKGGGPAAPAIAAINMALAAAVGTMQIAAVASAVPKPPRFHEGGVVQGRAGQEVTATLMAGEPVLTQTQFQNTMEAIANLANMKGGGTTIVEPKIEVKNTMADTARVNTGFDGEKMIIEIVNKALGDGRLDNGMNMKNLRQQGTNYQ